jgi:methylmalonyl-CoA/ethylmalonyl-CoA epimerase
MSATAAEFALRQIGQIALTVQDLDRAETFYRDVLGMRFLMRVPRMAFFDCGGIRLLLGLPEPGEAANPRSFVYYKVDEIHAACKILEERGVRMKGRPHLIAKLPDHDLWMAFFEDSEGNVLHLMSELRTP